MQSARNLIVRGNCINSTQPSAIAAAGATSTFSGFGLTLHGRRQRDATGHLAVSCAQSRSSRAADWPSPGGWPDVLRPDHDDVTASPCRAMPRPHQRLLPVLTVTLASPWWRLINAITLPPAIVAGVEAMTLARSRCSAGRAANDAPAKINRLGIFSGIEMEIMPEGRSSTPRKPAAAGALFGCLQRDDTCCTVNFISRIQLTSQRLGAFANRP